MPRVKIDNREVDVPAGATILEAARLAGIEIPTLCFLKGLEPGTSCMVCLVKVVGRPALQPACATRVEEGMAVQSEAPEVQEARKAALELLLSDHLGDCEAPCRSACPAHMNIPLMIRQIRAGALADAAATVKKDICLPSVLGRICPAPCEKVCRRHAKDSPLAVCLLKRFVGDADLASAHPYLPACKPASGKKVAIIGAGPAGLAAAYHLLEAGHACTVFDDHDLPGGALRYAVPEARLPRAVVDAEIDLIRRLGAEFRMGVRVGRDVSLDDLRRDFGAVAVAVGPIEDDTGRLGLPPARSAAPGAGAKGIEADHATHRTAVEGVFAAGDAIYPHRVAVRALAAGKGMAASIDQYLTGRPVTGPHRPFTVHIGHLREGELDLFMEGVSPAPRQAPPVDPAAPACLPSLDAAAAVAEAERCLHCDCRKSDHCRLRDWSQAIHAHAGRFRGERRTFQQQTSHPRILFEVGKCIDCGLCIQVARKWKEPLGLTFIGRGFDVRVAVPFGRPLADALQKAAEECAAACPTGAIALRDA